MLGVALTTASAALFLVLFLLESFGFLVNPYLGLLIFIALPVVFGIGLLLIPVGSWRSARRRRLHPEAADWPVIDLGDRRQRGIAIGVVALTFANIVIVSLAAYGGVHYMESDTFCGQVCHVTMAPEYEAHRVWPHAKVGCTACHVGPGVDSFVQAKLAGTRQLYHVVTGNVPMPIPTPVRSVGRTADTCEGCHSRDLMQASRLKPIREYADDEASSETVTGLVMKMGSQSEPGIHRHIGLDIEYAATDSSRGTVSVVRVKRESGDITEFRTEGADTAQTASASWRRMDCLDCHNRPAHSFSSTPQRAVDRALAQGQIPRDLPFIRREAVAVVSAEYADRATALQAIAARLSDFYRTQPAADRARVARAVRSTQDVWSTNVFPEMRVSFGSYANHLGHVDSPGCFRCHDDSHKAPDGKVISQDCELCHSIQ